MSGAKRQILNTILGKKEDGAVVIVEDVFEYSDAFRGATGAEVYAVTDGEIREAMKEKREYLRDMCDDVDAHGEDRRRIMTMNKAEYLEYRFETYRDVSREVIATALGSEVPERYTLSGCGRIFPRALDGLTLLDSDEVRHAVDLINEYEKD